MSQQWIYEPSGRAAFYQEEQYIYNLQVACVYWMSDGWFYKMPGEQAAFYTQDNWIYTPDGKPAYYYG